eukprot:137909-Chlamydomonas_euryale.AAC.1
MVEWCGSLRDQGLELGIGAAAPPAGKRGGDSPNGVEMLRRGGGDSPNGVEMLGKGGRRFSQWC